MLGEEYEEASTYHNKKDKVNPVPERVRILNVVHYIRPAFKTNHLVMSQCVGVGVVGIVVVGYIKIQRDKRH